MHCCFSIDYDQINMIKPASLSFLGNRDVVMWLDHCRNNWPRRHPRRPFLQELNSTIMWLNLIWICCKVGAPRMGIVPFITQCQLSEGNCCNIGISEANPTLWLKTIDCCDIYVHLHVFFPINRQNSYQTYSQISTFIWLSTLF